MNTLQVNPQYTNNVAKWQLVRDCVNDEVESKAKIGSRYGCNTGGYVIKPEGMSDSAYNAYCARAVFKNFVAQTLDVQKGAAFGKKYVFTGVDGVDLPESLNYLVSDIDGCNNSLDDQLKSVAQDIFSIGRIGALVEYQSSGDGSLADSNGAKIVTYTAESIQDWNECKLRGGKSGLDYVKLCEKYSRLDPVNYNRTDEERLIELMLDSDGLYIQKITDSASEGFEIIEPKNGNGQRLDYIPFTFIGADSNTSCVSRLPLYRLSTINIAHYRGDADKRTNIHLFSVPTVSFNVNSDVGVDQFMKINGLMDQAGNPTPPTIGGTAYVGCDIGFAQASTDSFLLTSQDADVSDMIKLGAQVISEGHAETAEAARIRKAAGTASLNDMVGNIQEAYIKLLSWCSMMNNASGQSDEFEFKMNDKFFDDRLSPQVLQQLIAGVMSNMIPHKALYSAMRRDGSLGVDDSMTLEDYLDLIDTQPDNLTVDV